VVTMTSDATTAQQQLDAALVAVADSLARLIREQPHRWEAMCRREASEVTILLQYHNSFGVNDELLPQVLLGVRIIELLQERHPQLLPPLPDDDAEDDGGA
jgi:hypothetical protein